MRDANSIRTLRDYSKPSHEGYRNTIELPVGNNVVPLQSDTIRLVQNGCSFHELRSEDPNQHLKDFLKLVDSLDLDGENRERTRLRLFQFSLHDQASNWLERLPAGSITTWEDLTTHFLAQFFPPRRTVKLRNNILMNQQHQGESISEAWTHFKDLLQKVPHHGIDHWLQIQIFTIIFPFILSARLMTLSAANSAIRMPTNLGRSLRTSPSTTIRAGMTQRTSSNRPNPQPQALGTIFEARVRDYMAAHTKRMERFENAIFKHQEEINDRMAKMFGLLKELTTRRAPEKEEKSEKDDVAIGDGIEKTNGLGTEIPVKEAKIDNGAKNRIKNKPIKRDEKGEGVEAPSSQPVKYYLKHRFNEKLIEGLVDNQRFNDSLSGVLVGKMKGKTYTLSPKGLKRMNALVDQRSDVNVMPLSTYIKLTDERHVETDIRLSLASHSYIYPLGIAEDVLVDVASFLYPVDFVILDIKEDKKRPFILGTPFLTMAKAVIKFDKGTITLRSGKSKISFHRIPESLGSFSKKTKRKFCSEIGDGVRIYPDGVIFDKKKLGSS
ncbi:zinc finger, CCHC-type containing protein [Tanacetum coccineum]